MRAPLRESRGRGLPTWLPDKIIRRVTSWEYAEVQWVPGREPHRSKTTWYSANGQRGIHASGLKALANASADGWEVIGYRSAGSASRGYSVALLRRPRDAE